MKILSTAFLLGLTLLVVPLFTYYFGIPLDVDQWNTLKILATITVGSIIYCFVIGEITGNNSQVDKLWSILPIIYVWTVASRGEFHPRLMLMALLVTLWGVRLTTNFALKGAYQWKFWEGEEDYRWKLLRDKPDFQPKWKWTLFNLFFISIYQNILILLFTLPTIVVLQHLDSPLNRWDLFIGGAMFFFIVFEMIADIQHWNYQSKKWKLINSNKPLGTDYAKGFLDKGLWAYSRHPNYFAEQMIWICFYFFSVAASGMFLNWSAIGGLLLIMLFAGSATFSEEISASKYKDYTTYQKRVSRFVPWIPK